MLDRALGMLNNPVASLFRLEHAGPSEALAAARALRESLAEPQHQDLRRAFVVWYMGVLRRRLRGVELPELRELEEVETMIAEKAPVWTDMWLEQGREQGRREGESTMLLRQLERRFGSPDTRIRQRVQSADADRLLEWGDRILTAERVEDIFGDG